MLINNRIRKIIIWYNPNKNIYYHRGVSGFYCNYYIGFVNQYNHKIVDIIEIDLPNYKLPLKKRLLRKLISFLENLERR